MKKGKWISLVVLFTTLAMLVGCDVGASPTATPLAVPTDTPAAAASSATVGLPP